MSFRKSFNDLKAKFEQHTHSPPNVPFLSKPNASQLQSPSIPFGSKPPPAYYGAAPPAQNYGTPRQGSVPYWQPQFDPSIHITQEFRQEQGDHGWGNNELENYTDRPENSFYTSDNKLILRAIAASAHPDPKQRYTSARLNTRQLLSRPRGYLEASITSPIAEGIWPAFWLLPADPFQWPTDGEVDIMELWNGERFNHSCLHWGQHNGEDWNKHRVIRTELPQIDHRPHAFGFAWDSSPDGRQGRCVWYIDGRAVMKAEKPAGTRPWQDFRVLLNVAMGGTVCAGKVPRDGCYDLIVHSMMMCDGPPCGWQGYENDWRHCQEGRPNA